MSYLSRLRDNFGFVCKSKVVFAFQLFLPKTEKNKAYAFVGRHGITPYPYKSALKWKQIKAEVFVDEQHNLPYVVHNGKKLYFPHGYDIERIQGLYKTLLAEQQLRAAHRYVDNYQELADYTLLDIGTAEGIFTLDAVEYIRQAYLFECDERWIEALEATFALWRSKIHIVKKYVSDVDDGDTIRLDTFLQDKNPDKIFLKMDIEGYEQKALRGAQQTLRNAKNVRCAVCTYHNTDDAAQISTWLAAHHFDCQFTEGYLFWDGELRKAVVRGQRR
ncbi:hypothetical protein FACS189452_01550 [Bacteroidia bacterium]|nr:hypothetical protein FACS189452_01550 [Bacteroidia bacterium]